MKPRKAYSAIAVAILCASCLPPDATKFRWSQLPPGATVLVDPPANPRAELIWSETMIDEWLHPVNAATIHEWLKGAPTVNAQNCMPQKIFRVDPSGTLHVEEWEPFGFNPILNPKQHADASCWQDGPVLDVHLAAEPVYLYRQRIYHFHAVDGDDANAQPCEKEKFGTECDMDLIRVCLDKKTLTPGKNGPMWEGYVTPCKDSNGKNTTGPNGCAICVPRSYPETPG